MTSKLSSAIKKLEQGHLAAATDKLQAFIDQLNELMTAEHLTVEDGQPLIDGAQTIIDNIRRGAR